MFASRVPVLLVLTACSLAVLRCEPAHAQWWSRAPADFEECADLAEQSPSKEEKTAALAQCNAKFAGRRKPGGGYTYYDFMQNRIFDIAGPNPTPEEQKYIDQQYSLYLEKHGRDNVATAFMTRPQPQNLQQASLRDVPVRAAIEPERVPLPIQRPSRPPSADARAGQGRALRQGAWKGLTLLQLSNAVGEAERPEAVPHGPNPVPIPCIQGEEGLSRNVVQVSAGRSQCTARSCQ